MTPPSVVRTLVDMLEPYQGRVYDPCCGTGGMFVQSIKFIAEHARRADQPEELAKRKIAVYGQERNDTTYRLAKMNLAVHGIDAEIAWNHEGSFHRDAFPDLEPPRKCTCPHANAGEEDFAQIRVSAGPRKCSRPNRDQAGRGDTWRDETLKCLSCSPPHK